MWRPAEGVRRRPGSFCWRPATGAAHPVLLGAEMDAVMKQKVENDAAAYLRSICGKRGRNSALAETAVLESKSFTEREALDRKLVDLVAPGERQLLGELDGRTVTRHGCGDAHHQHPAVRGADPLHHRPCRGLRDTRGRQPGTGTCPGAGGRRG